MVGFILGVVSFLLQLQSALLPGDNKVNDIANMFNNLFTESSFFNLEPLLQKLGQRGPLGGVDSTTIANNGSQLLIGLTGVDDGGAYYVTTDSSPFGQLFPFGPGSTYSGTVDLVSACIASVALPPFSPPISLGYGGPTEEFFDGSLRDSVPIDLAIAQGARSVLAIVPVGPTPSTLPANFFSQTNTPSDYGGIFGIQARANDISAHTIQTDSGGIASPIVTLIQPTFTVHNHWAVDPGVISIAMAYGYMRAGEVMSENTAISPISDQIVALRFEIWGLENQANADADASASAGHFGYRGSNADTLSPTGDATLIPLIRDHKNKLRELVCNYLGGGGILPSVDFRSASELQQLWRQDPTPGSPFDVLDYRAWWIQWERHSYTPNSLTPWHSFSDGSESGWSCPPVDTSIVSALLDPCAEVTIPPVPMPDA